MKTVQFQGRSYSAPEWAKYITQDSSGLIEVHEMKPKNVYDDSSGISYWRSSGQSVELYFPSCVCEEIVS